MRHLPVIDGTTSMLNYMNDPKGDFRGAIGRDVRVAITCSAGFYVRSFAHALGELIERDGRPADAVIAFYVRTHDDLEGASRGAVLTLVGAILRRRSLIG